MLFGFLQPSGVKFINNFVFVIATINIFKDLYYPSLYIDQVGLAFREQYSFDGIQFSNFLIRITKQCKRNFVLFSKFFVTCRIIITNSKYPNLFGYEFIKMITNSTGFFRTAGSIIFGIEINNDFLTKIGR